MLSTRKKANAIKKVQRHDNDTGSPEAQVAVLSKRIDELSSHLKKNDKDNHSRRGLLKMVKQRQKHLEYVKDRDPKAHAKLVKELGLKK